jgi:phosphate butyryltransferase
MKGFLPSGVFIHAVLDRQIGLHVPGTLLSSVALLELTLNGRRQMLSITDPGFIPLPDLEMKKAMIQNTVRVLRLLGCENPKVAVLSVSEDVNPKILSSTEARALQEMNERDEITDCSVCGPISMDLAISEAAAEHKGFHHPVAGRADLLLVPSLEVGNAVLKTITQLIDPPAAGFVCGTTKPVVFTSRADTTETKRNSIAMAALLSERGSDGKGEVQDSGDKSRVHLHKDRGVPG